MPPSRHHPSDQVGREDRLDRRPRGRIDVPDPRIWEVRMGGDGDVRGEGPGGRRPDHRVPGVVAPGGGDARDQGKVHVNAGRGLVLVFELRLGERGAVGHAPVNRLQLPEDVAALEQVGQYVHDAGLETLVERQIRSIPVARDAQAEELVALDPDPLQSLDAAPLADLGRVHARDLRSEVLGDLVLDRQAVAVPARHIGGLS